MLEWSFTMKRIIHGERVEVTYDSSHWRLLSNLRNEASRIMRALLDSDIRCITHGSIARGDVTEKSDIDIFIPYVIPSFIVETALEDSGFKINRRVLIQATPNYAVKAYIEIGELRYVSFPLVKLKAVERDFYRFGGEIDLSGIERNIRVMGVDKRLMLIEPTENGHVESSIIGREDEVARLLGVTPSIVLDRVRTLTRRDRVGRTGVFIERELTSDESFEMVLKRIADMNPAVRRRLRNG